MKINQPVRFIFLPMCVAGLLLFHAVSFAGTIRVKPLSAGGNDNNAGGDWDDAKATVQGAIDAASEGDQIWVAAGTYEERIHNKVVDGQAVNVAFYGGFAGNETDLDQRDWNINLTILDGADSGTVVTITGGAGPETHVDGFYITRGTGGISISNSAPTVKNNTIKDNAGSGVSILKYKIIQIDPPVVAHALVSHNKIVDNEAGNGAGIGIAGDLLTNLVPAPASAPVITYNIIARNSASQNGGGIGCWGHTSPVISNNYILANSATNYEPGWDGDDPVGPWLVGGGGIFASKKDMGGTPVEYAISAPKIINNVVAANGALLGGGICLVDYPKLSEPNNPPAVVTNNTVVANNGSGIFWGNTFPTVRNNLVAFNTWGLEQDQSSSPTLGYNNVYGNEVQSQKSDYKGIADQTGLNGNISADPKMANYEIGEFHLQPGSACIDAGSADVTETEWRDIDGQDRVIGNGVDIGADESEGTSWNIAAPIIHVHKGGDDAENGLTWETAKKTVTGGIAEAAETGGEVWVATGAYTEHITIPSFIYLYGGFAGTETDRASRNVKANPTILDGGGIPTIVLSKNAGYLVSALDGFTIQNGGVYRGNVNPDWSWGVEGRGGGIRSAVTSLHVTNNTITRNSFGNPYDNAGKRGHGAGIHGYLSHSVMKGNTITENEILNTFDGSGAGMYFKLSLPTIEENSITWNHARYGSAIYCVFSIPRIVGNIIENNAMYDSYPLPLYFGSVEGAITLDMGEDLLIEANIITRNTAGTGAGINVKTNLAGRIQNNLIINNTAYDPTAGGGIGGGIYCLVPPNAVDNQYVVNNTIVENKATYPLFPPPLDEQGGGLAISLPPPLPPEPSPPPGKLVIANNILAYNSSGIFQTLTSPMLAPKLINNDLFNTGTNYINLSPGLTDLSEAPFFVDRDGPDDDPVTTEDNDYHLSPESPCIDGGGAEEDYLPKRDFEGQVRVFDGDNNGSNVVDIGADEFVIPPTGDINGDGIVDLADAIVALQALVGIETLSISPTADINKDGKTSMAEVFNALHNASGLRE